MVRLQPRELKFLALLLCIGLAGVWPLPAAALDIFGLKLFEDDTAEQVIADPQPYTVDFRVSGAKDLQAQLQEASSLWTGRDEPASGAAGLLATARADYRRLVAALYAEGYYGGAVSITVDGREADDLPPDADLRDTAAIVVQIATGPLFRFGTTGIANPPPAAAIGTGDDALAFTPGNIARSGAIRAAARRAVEGWRLAGYPKARLAGQDVTADHATRRVDVTLKIDPGPKAVIGAISVDGATDVDAGFIVRQSGLTPGRLYNPADIDRARTRLVDLEVFSVIRIEEAEAVTPEGALPLTIIVQERKPRRVGVGATWSSTDGLGTEAFWLHRNLFGEAERLRLDARLAGIGYPVDTADFNYLFGATFTKPGIFTPETAFVANLTAEHNVLERYTETAISGRLGFTHDFSEEITTEFGINAKRSRVEDPVYGVRDFTLAGLYGGTTFDSRDDAADATQGFYANVLAEPFYETQFGNAALRMLAEGRAYFALDPDKRFVLAGRLKAGGIIGAPVAETPPDKLFFAGGGGSVRGYPYRSIGVEGPGGAVTGGKFLTEASAELRARVTENLGVVGFVDAGYVTAETFAGLAEGTRLGAGLGLRYYTGFGPLRLDLGLPLNKRPGDPDYALYVGIGQAF